MTEAFSDHVHVQRIKMNFASNASKYAQGSDIELKAREATRQQIQNLSFLYEIGTTFGEIAPHWAENALLLAR